jgi:predicted nucleic acid-binding protein
VIPTSQVSLNNPPAGSTKTSDIPEATLDETIDIAKTCHAFLEKLDMGDGRKLFHEVEADVENAGKLLFKAFAGDDEEKKSFQDTLLEAFASKE